MHRRNFTTLSWGCMSLSIPELLITTHIDTILQKGDIIQYVLKGEWWLLNGKPSDPTINLRFNHLEIQKDDLCAFPNRKYKKKNHQCTCLWKRWWNLKKWTLRQRSGLDHICSTWVQGPAILTARGKSSRRTSKSYFDDLRMDLKCMSTHSGVRFHAKKTSQESIHHLLHFCG